LDNMKLKVPCCAMPALRAASVPYSSGSPGSPVTERRLAVGGADRPVGIADRRVEVFQVAVVGENPVSAPQLPHEGVGVDQRHRALGRFADVGNDVHAADRVLGDQRGDRRIHRGLGVDEHAAAGTLEESDAEAIGMVVGAAAAMMEAAKRETNVGGDVAVHPQKLAHGYFISRQLRESARRGAALHKVTEHWPCPTRLSRCRIGCTTI
jgi:hypothetical protein